MVTAVVWLLWCNFWVLAEHYFFEFVMVSFIDRKFIGASLGTVNCTMPNLDEAGYDYRMSGLVESSKTKNLHGRTWGRVLC